MGARPQPRRSPRRAGFGTALGATLLAAGCSLPPQKRFVAPEPPPPTARVQSIIGASFYDDFVFQATDPALPGQAAEADLSTMPTVGIAGQQRFSESKLEYGLEGGLLLSWWFDEAEVAGVAGGSGAVVVINIESYVLLADIFVGPYVALDLTDRLRASLGGGGLLDIAMREIEQNDLDSTTSDGFGLGLYARAGLEFEVSHNTWFGVGYRVSDATIDFGSTSPDLEADGHQVYALWTVAYGGRRSRIGAY